MGIEYIPGRRTPQGGETLYLPLEWGNMRDASENPLSATTYPKVPVYDTAVTGTFDCATQTGTGTTANIWWVVITVPKTYVAASNLTLKIDGEYVFTGDSVAVAITVDVEAFPYDSTNGDFSNTDICATAAQTLTSAFGTKSFTLTGTTITVGTQILLRFTSSIQITSGGGAGTGKNTFNFPRIEYTGKE